MKTIVFIESFATKNKGDILTCDSMLASDIVHVHKVAKYYKKPAKKGVKDEKPD